MADNQQPSSDDEKRKEDTHSETTPTQAKLTLTNPSSIAAKSLRVVDPEFPKKPPSNLCGTCNKNVAAKYRNDETKFEKRCFLCENDFLTCLKCAFRYVNQYQPASSGNKVTKHVFDRCTDRYLCFDCNEKQCFCCGLEHQRGKKFNKHFNVFCL